MAIPLKYNLRNLFVRRISTTMTVLSIGLVVGVFVALTDEQEEQIAGLLEGARERGASA